MITSLSKIIPFIPNVKLRINSIDYSSPTGIAEVDATAIDSEGGDLFNVILPVSSNSVSDMLKDIEAENKTPTILNPNRRRNVSK
jgi:hypothetical protein